MSIDKAVLNKLYNEIFNGCYETFAQIVDMFVLDTPKSLNEMKAKFDGGDFKAVVHIAHTLKSNGASLGAKDFSAICQLIEDSGKKGELGQFPQWSAQLDAEFTICSVEIRKEIQAPAA